MNLITNTQDTVIKMNNNACKRYTPPRQQNVMHTYIHRGGREIYTTPKS